MKLQTITNRLGEPLLQGKTASGLTLLINPRPRYRMSFAALGTNFGSIDRVSTQDGSPVPMGLAHFLEHKLFENEQGDVSDRFAEIGASSNAMTSFCGTTYIASTTGDPLPVIDLLLDFVQEPWFTDELVAKEQGIIAQEIRMYDDDPDWRAFFGLLECLYEHHPVKDNIAGTVESIAEIDADTLRRCYDRFYHPKNLCLSVAGGIDPDALAALVESDQAQRSSDGRDRHVRAACDERPGVLRSELELELPVQRPRLLIGIKESVLGGSGEQVARRQLATRVALDILFGRSSGAFQELYGEGLVDESFGASHSAESDFGFTTIGGDTDQPEQLAERVLGILRGALTDGLDAEAFSRTRNKLQGLMLRAIDSPETVASGSLSACFRDVSAFAVLDLVESLDEQELLSRLAEHVTEDAITTAIVRPRS
jgi:predicted Zn-dependent peptidase